MPLPAFAEGRVFEEHEQIVGDDPDSEEGRISALLAARHPFHAEADFEFLDAILGMFTPLAVPDQHIGGTARAVAGNDVVMGPVFFQQFHLMVIPYYDETEGFVGMLHAVHGLGYGAIGILGPGGIWNGGDGCQRRGIQFAADGEGLAGLFAVIEQIGLIAGGVRTDGRKDMVFGQARLAGFDEIKIGAGRSDIPSPEVVVD